MAEAQDVEGILTENDMEMARRRRPLELEPSPRGPESPSTRVGSFLASRQADYVGQKEVGWTRVLGDVLELVGQEQSDIFDQKGENAKDELKELTEFKNKVIDITATTAGEVKDEQKKDIASYIIEKIEDDIAHGGKYQEVLKKYLRIIPDNLLPKKYQSTKDEVIENSEKEGEENERVNEQAQLPDYRYAPGQPLESFFEKTKGKVTLSTIKEFMTATREDFGEQNKQFEAENADLVAAIDKADVFSQEQGDQRNSGRLIKVIKTADDDLRVGWQDDLDEVEGQTFLFDPEQNSGSPISLGFYVQRRRQYIDRVESAKNAEQLLESLLGDPHKKISTSESMYLESIILLHQKYLNESSREIRESKFPGLDDDELEKIRKKDPESVKPLLQLGERSFILEQFKKQIYKRSQNEQPKKRMFKGIEKFKGLLKKNRSEK